MKYLNRFWLTRASIAFVCLFLSQGIFAQNVPTKNELTKARILEKDQRVQEVVFSKERTTPFMLTFDLEQENVPSLDDAQNLIENLLSVKKSKEKFAYSKTIPFKNGVEFKRFEQFYEDIKVEHGDYVALGKDNQLASLSGEYYPLENINTTPTLTEEAALELAKQAVGGEYFSWDYLLESYNGVVAPELAVRWQRMYDEYSPQTELVIVDDFNAQGNNLDLAWKFNVYALSPKTVRDWVYVNAHTGKIMLRDPIIKHLNDEPHSAVVNTRYSKTQTIQTTRKELTLTGPAEPNPFFDATGGVDQLFDGRGHVDYAPWTLETECYVLIDQTRGGANTTIETYDINGAGGVPLSLPIYGMGRSVTDDDNDWTDAEHIAGIASATNPAEREYDNDIAWDAHWGAGEVYDYWQDIHQRDSYDGAGASIYSFVHIGNAFDNAFWNGSVMSYGDGQSFKPLTSLDVCAHEVGHAICTFTSNLVYALESGGMNEGFSDIWAACQEYYNIQKDLNSGAPQNLGFGALNPDGYDPFGIGEQIDVAAVGLRRMDNPKRSGDPETYNGEDFTRAEGCTPGLTNDQCGVHSNSGVLNKWFYLLTVGSGLTGSGPAAQYAGVGANADDGLRDAVDGANITPDTEPYTVTGLGFEIAEIIAFGCEVGLTSTATFHEARNVSIQFAKTMYGACSPEEESTTDAWYAVGVGDEYTDCSPSLALGFSRATSDVIETVIGEDICEPTQIIEVPLFITGAVTTAITIDEASTATLDKDFTTSDLNINYSGSEFTTQSIIVTIIDDGIEEPEETIILKIPSALTSTEFETHTITITNDDITPVIGGTINLYTNAMEITAGNLPTRVSAINPPGSPSIWTGGSGLGTGAGSGAIVDNQTSAGLTVAEYNPSVECDIILYTDLIDARQLENVNVAFTYGVGGEERISTDGIEPVDYGEVVYSFDGVEFIGTGQILVRSTGQGPVALNFSQIIPELANTEFYLGWRWRNDAVGGGGASLCIDQVDITAQTRGIETVAGSNVDERVDENTTVYFKSYQDGDLIARLDNPSEDLGCVAATVVESGNAAQTLTIDAASGDRSPKVFEITNDKFATYDLTLYVTTEELGGLDQSTLKIGKIIGTLDDPKGIIIDESTTVESVGTDAFAFTSTAANGAFQGFSTFVLTNITEVDVCPDVDDNQIGQPCDDGNGCTINDVFTIDCECIGEVTDPITINDISTTDEQCADGMGEAVITMSNNAVAPYSVDINNGTTTFTTSDNPFTVSNLSAGAYTIAVSDNNTCVTEAGTFNIANNSDAFSLNNNGNSTITCFGGNDGSILLSPDPIATVITSYTWSDGSPDGANRTNLVAGTYRVTATAAVGCPAIEEFVITQPDAVDFTFSKTQETCGNAMASASVADLVGGDGAYTVAWSTGEEGMTISGLSAANNPYSVTVTDGNDCTANRTFDIVNTSDGFTLNTPNITDAACNGDANGSIELATTDAVGQTTFSWSDGTTTTAMNNAATTLSNLSADTYSVTVTDAAGCEVQSMEFTVNEPAAIVINGLSDQVACADENEMITYTANVTGGVGDYTYQWTETKNGQTTILASTTNSIQVTATENATYQLSVGDANDCTASSEVIALTILEAGDYDGTQTITEGETAMPFNVTEDATLGSTYQWQSAPGTTANFSNISDATDATYAPGELTTTTSYRRVTTTTQDGKTCMKVGRTVVVTVQQDNSLSVQWLYIDAVAKEKTNVVKWATTAEFNAADYFVEWSNDGKGFTKIGYVAANNRASEYEFVHPNPTSGLNYYRVQQADVDGKVTYSKTVTLTRNDLVVDQLSLYPNPTTDAINITLPQAFTTQQTIQVQLYNIAGKLMLQTTLGANATINMGNLPAGVYQVVLQQDQNRSIGQVVKMD